MKKLIDIPSLSQPSFSFNASILGFRAFVMKRWLKIFRDIRLIFFLIPYNFFSTNQQ